jgi:hypothetical protein
MSTQKAKTNIRRWALLVLLVSVVAAPQLYAADKNSEDFDAYTIRIDGFWLYSKPTGTFTGDNHDGSFNLSTDVGFNSYSTFSGKLDWKFTRKNHLYFEVVPFDQTKEFVDTRTIDFRGQTYVVGTSIAGRLKANAYAPGYQYDIFRRKQWNLGLRAQINLLDIDGSLNAAAQVVNGAPHSAVFSSGRLLAPLPVLGPDLRIYPIPNSSRLFVTGNLLGMYFFGYGNYYSTAGTLGLTITKHLSARGGYQIGSRMNINTKTNSIGVDLTQKGPLAGLEVSF